MPISTPTFYGSLNARMLTPQQVAHSFVEPDYFRVLMKQRHTLILGPRGSGKTTVLKMLTPEALDHWRDPAGNEVRKSVPFLGVFIPTDITWMLSTQVAAAPQICDALKTWTDSALCYHVLRRMADVFAYCLKSEATSAVGTHLTKASRRAIEKKLVIRVAELWKLPLPLPTLDDLLFQIDLRQSEIAIQTARILQPDSASQPRSVEEFPDFCFLDFVQIAAAAFRIFASLMPLASSRCALLFDELELVPDHLLKHLMRLLRSTDEALLFKLSLSPYSETAPSDATPTSAQKVNDFDTVALWYGHKEESLDFSRRLADRFLQLHGRPGSSSHELLGSSPSDPATDDKSRYAFGESHQRAFASLSKKDASFASYLKNHHLDVSKLDVGSEANRAADVRKIVSLVLVRDAFLASRNSKAETSSDDDEPDPNLKPKKRSRKNPPIYHGCQAVFAACEGNPRWLTAVLEEFLSSGGSHAHFTPSIQNQGLNRIAGNFRKLLKTLPVSDLRLKRGNLSLLDAIGNNFFDNVVNRQFTPDPVLSFSVDSHADLEILQTIGMLINTGALVLVPEDKSSISMVAANGSGAFALKGKRLRLAYLLNVHYRLPLILGKSKSLSRLLRYSEQSGELQKSLFPFDDREEDGTNKVD